MKEMTNAARRCRKIGLFLLVCCLCMSMTDVVLAAKKPAKPQQVTNVQATNSGKTAQKVKWKKVKGVSGYQVYCRDCSSTKNKFKKIKTLKGASKVSLTVKNRKKGRVYAYKVRAYKKNKKGTSYGPYSSIAYGMIPKKNAQKQPAVEEVQAEAGVLSNPTLEQKYRLIFGEDAQSAQNLRYPGSYYKKKSAAEKNMTSITVKTWDFVKGKSGAKKTRTFTIKVHKNLAPTVKQIFKEIYNHAEKFPIHDLGGYSWRGGHTEHNTGTAIDINPLENYMVNVQTGVITSGKYWKPGKDPYSIPKDGVVAQIFAKYGFAQGDWGASKDYMHFSYFWT